MALRPNLFVTVYTNTLYMTLWSTVPSPHTRVYSALAGATTTSDLLSFLMKVSGVQTEPGGSVT